MSVESVQCGVPRRQTHKQNERCIRSAFILLVQFAQTEQKQPLGSSWGRYTILISAGTWFRNGEHLRRPEVPALKQFAWSLTALLLLLLSPPVLCFVLHLSTLLIMHTYNTDHADDLLCKYFNFQSEIFHLISIFEFQSIQFVFIWFYLVWFGSLE